MTLESKVGTEEAGIEPAAVRFQVSRPAPVPSHSSFKARHVQMNDRPCYFQPRQGIAAGKNLQFALRALSLV